MTNNTSPNNDNETNADTAIDNADQIPDPAAIADKSLAEATDPAILTRREDSVHVFTHNGRARRASNIL